MKKQLYIHIGCHKTGTSSIQNFFWLNRRSLSKLGILYPEIGLSGPTHAHFALSLPSNRDEMISAMSTITNQGIQGHSYSEYIGEPAERLYTQLGKIVSESNFHTILLSSECFMEWIEPSVIHSFIRDHCDCSIKILAYIRRQDIWIQSIFNQIVKDPGLRYAGEISDMPQMQLLDYYSTLTRWSDTFGIENTYVRVFENSTHHPGGVVDDVLDQLGIRNHSSLKCVSNKGRENVSIPSNLLHMLHYSNQRGLSQNLYEDILRAIESESVNKTDGSPLIMSYSQATSLFDQYEESNRLLADTYLNGVFPFEAPKQSEYSDNQSLSAETIVDILMHIAHKQ